jgi:hypothetical protein
VISENRRSGLDVRRFIGRKTLDFVEALPKFERGIFGHLQDIRRFQREHAAEAYRESRPPEGSSLDLLYVRLIEVFQIEDFPALYSGLLGLFPELRDFPRHDDFRGQFWRFADTISVTGDMAVGTISRRERSLPFRTAGTLPDLPDEVVSIDVWLHKIIPSIFVVTLDVHVSSQMVERITALQSRPYLPSVRFWRLVPFRRRLGYSQSHSEAEMCEAISRYLDQVQRRVEETLQPWLHGYFSALNAGRARRLPSVVVVGLKGVPEDEEAFEKWTKDAFRWLESFGIGHGVLFKGSERIWIPPESVHTEITSRYFLCLLWEQYIRSITVDGFGGERVAGEYHSRYTLDAVLPCVSIVECLSSIQRNVERLRRISLGALGRRRFVLNRMRHYFTLGEVIAWQSILLERLELEFGERKTRIRHELRYVEDLKSRWLRTKLKQENTLSASLLDAVDSGVARLGKYLGTVRRAFSETLVARNMAIMYRLQVLIAYFPQISPNISHHSVAPRRLRVTLGAPGTRGHGERRFPVGAAGI